MYKVHLSPDNQFLLLFETHYHHRQDQRAVQGSLVWKGLKEHQQQARS